MPFVLVALFSCAAWAEPATQPDDATSRAELEQQLVELQRQVEVLKRQLAPPGVPINLGRTNLAEVSSSGVNGSRPDHNMYYGVRNAFDGGENFINNINYTYWLSGGGPGWIEAVFDHPVVMRWAEVDGPAATLRLYDADDRQLATFDLAPRATFDEPVFGVCRARIEFKAMGRNARVNEVFLMGDPPVGVELITQTPRIFLNDNGARIMAKEALQEWQQMLLFGVAPRVTRTDTGWEVEYRRDDQVYFRAIIDRRTSEMRVEPRVHLTPIPKSGCEHCDR